MKLQYKRILITGGAGFIGSHLTDYLLSKGIFVHVIDDLSNGFKKNLPLENDHLLFEQLDISDYFSKPEVAINLKQAVANADIVFHLASPIGVQYVHLHGLETVQRILKGGLCIVDICHQYRCPLLFTSSSEIYGSGNLESLKESNFSVNSGLQPRWSYGVAKLAVEHLVADLHRKCNIPTWIIRLFNVVGARQIPRTGLVIPCFCQAILDQKPLVIHGDGNQRRNFIHVTDAVHGMIAVIQNQSLCGQAVNLGGFEEISIKELAKRVLILSNTSGEINFSSYQDIFGDNFAPVLNRKPDLGFITSTGWKPQLTLDCAIKDCLQSLQDK